MDSQEADPTLEVVVRHPISSVSSWVPLVVLGAFRMVCRGVPGGRAVLCALLAPRFHDTAAHWEV